MSLELPFVTHRNRLWVAAVVGLTAMTLYSLVGATSEALSPTVLPLSGIDHTVPLIPWTFWLYATIYFIYAVACLLIDDLRTFRVFLTGYVIANLLSSIVFLTFPTTFPRDLFPVGDANIPGDISSRALHWFRTVDRPTNCFPSMHVGCATLSAMAFRKRSSGMFTFFVFWAVGISFATLGTKQHYFVDVLGGASIGILSYWVAERLVAGGVEAVPKPVGRTST